MRRIFNYLNVFLFNNLLKRGLTEPRKIILVSNTALGDTILSTPAIKSIRLNFPEAKIVLIVHKNLYSFFKEFEFVDEVEVFKSSLIGLTRQALCFRKKEFDTILFLHSNGPQDLYLALLLGANNILKSINYPGKVSEEFQTLMMNKIDYKNTKHIIEHRLDLVRSFNPTKLEKSLSVPCKYYLKDYDKESNIIALQLSAADIYKVWPLSSFIELMIKIVDDLSSNCKIILCGVNSEMALASNFEEKFKYRHLVQNLCGKTSIQELQLILQSANLLITNDTGTLHLAVAVKTPTISLFSPTDPKVYGPYQDLDMHKVICIDGSYINNKPKKQRSQEAMNLIPIDDVYNAFQNLKKDYFVCVE